MCILVLIPSGIDDSWTAIKLSQRGGDGGGEERVGENEGEQQHVPGDWKSIQL